MANLVVPVRICMALSSWNILEPCGSSKALVSAPGDPLKAANSLTVTLMVNPSELHN